MCISCGANLGSVTADEVVHGLFLGQLAHRRQHPKGITAQQDEILGVGPDTWYPGICNVVNGVGRPSVLCHRTASHSFIGHTLSLSRIWHNLVSMSPNVRAAKATVKTLVCSTMLEAVVPVLWPVCIVSECMQGATEQQVDMKHAGGSPC